MPINTISLVQFIVSGNPEEWEGKPFDLEVSRVFEYTNQKLRDRFKNPDEQLIGEFKSFPCIFAYEQQHKQDPKFGWITAVKKRQLKVRVEYKLENLSTFINHLELMEKEFDLDIRKLELNRTHWALKDVDLAEELKPLGINIPAFSALPNAGQSFQYDLAISFAGEDRTIAEYFAKKLDGAGYSVFYDNFESARLWGSDLPVEFEKIYANQARFCLILVSKHYLAKIWTNYERQQAISRLMDKGNDYILPLQLDDSKLPGLPTKIGYQSLLKNSKESVFELLFAKLGAPLGNTKTDISPREQVLARNILEASFRRALFTKMNSEISLSAMFDSLKTAMTDVQSSVAKIMDPALQILGLKVIQSLDKLERFETTLKAEIISNHLDQLDRAAIDSVKLEIIDALLQIRRRAGLTFQMPTALSFDHFYSEDQANQSPTL